MGYRTIGSSRASVKSAVASNIVVANSPVGFKLSGSSVTAETLFAAETVSPGQASVVTTVKSVAITNVIVTDSNYNNLDDMDINNVTGGYAKIIGRGFVNGAVVYLNNAAVTSAFISSTEVRITVPPTTSGTYALMLFNPTGDGAIYLNLQFSTAPSFSTAAGTLGTVYEFNATSTNILASGDAPLTYSLFSGSLPPGVTLSSGGVLSGTTTATNVSSTYSFVIKIEDPDLQETTRSFTLTIAPDVVTWVTPASNSTIDIVKANNYYANLSATSAAGRTVSYQASGLPVGITLNNGVLSGVYTGSNTTETSTLTAVANTTLKQAVSTITWAISFSDTFFNNVTTLINANTPTTSVFVDDASTNNFPVTIVGDTRPNNFGPYTPGYYSNLFDGTGDYLTSPASALNQMTGNFTVELWIYPTSIPAQAGLVGINNTTSSGAANFGIYLETNRNITFFVAGNNPTYSSSNTPITIGAWQHIAFVRSGSTNTVYVNGVSVLTNSVTPSWSGTPVITVGRLFGDSTGVNFYGYISNLRVVKGTAVYTAAFTPPTQSLTAIPNTVLLTCQSNRLIDNSANNFALTRAGNTAVSGFDPYQPTGTLPTSYFSNYFDGTGDYLTATTNSTFALTGDFTIEMWVYPTAAIGSYRALIATGGAGSSDQLLISADSSINGIYLATVSSGNGVLPEVNLWSHVAVSRTGTSVRFFLNGIQQGTTKTSSATALASSATLSIGYRAVQADGAFTGYISNVRVVKGTALYTANFTPPTAPLTAIAGTSLLTCQNNTFIDNSTNNFAITVFGNTTPSQFAPYDVVGNSVQFDGTGDYLTVPNNVNLTIGSGDFTIECWVYISGAQTTTYGYAVAGPHTGQGSTGWGIVVNRSIDTRGFAFVVQGAFVSNDSTFLPVNQWHHLAVTRSGSGSNNLKLFKNGIMSSQTTYTTTDTYVATPVYIGADGLGGQGFPGYISNFRFVSGTAVYTANFTPPTQPLTAITNTSLLTCQSNLFIDVSANKFSITPFGNTVISALSPFVQATPAITPVTAGSTYFDGTGDLLTVAGTGAVVRSSGSFTIEGWYYPTSSAELFRAVYSSGTGYATAGRLYQNNTTLTFYINATTGITGSIGWTLNTWNHFAVTWNGTTSKVYINGQQSISTTSFTYSGTVDLSIGEATYSPFGYISNFRIADSVVYTAAFTPPTAPLTAISGTRLLTCQTNQPANNNVFIDNSTNNLLITRAGNATQGTFSPYGENWNNYFDGTGDYLSIPNNSALDLATGGGVSAPFTGAPSFTIECWFYCTALTADSQSIINKDGTAYYAYTQYGFSITSTGLLRLTLGHGDSASTTNGTEQQFTILNSIALNTWYHVAACQATPNQIYTFLNGTLISTTTRTQYMANGGNPLLIGYMTGQSAGHYFNGFVSNVRIIKGTALYTANFTPSTTPLLPIAGTSLLTCQSPNLVDNSANRFAITRNGDVSVQKFAPFASTALPTPYYSAYFDGSGDYLTLPSNQTQFIMGTGDFTVEMWVYVINFAATRTLYDTVAGGDATGTGRFGIQISTGGVIQLFTGAGSVFGTSASTVTAGSWNHIAYSRNSNSGGTRVYLNGAQTIGPFTDNTNYVVGTVTRPVIGINAYNTSSNPMFGYISNLRVVKGTGLYTTTFTPSTTPLTAITGTSLLTCQSNRFIDNSTNNFAITAFGNAIPSQFVPFAVSYSTKQSYTPAVFGGSVYCDGVGDNIETQNLVVLTPSTNFTAECWVYNLGFSGSQYGRGIFSLVDTTNNDRILVRLSNGSNAVNLYGAVAGSSTFGQSGTSSALTAAPMAWTHVALVRQGSSFVVYLNGVAAITTTSAANFGNIRRVRIGGNTDGSTPDFNGYISNFRYVNGTAVYRSQFVPQNIPVTAVENTALLVNGTSAGVYDSSGMNNYETVGDAKIDTTVVKFAGTNSMKFDGNGDSLRLASTVALGFGTGDFTVEYWVYSISWSTGPTVVDLRTPSGASLQWSDNFSTSGAPGMYYHSTQVLVSSITIPLSTWAHVAYTRQGSTVKVWVNGVQGATGTSSSDLQATGGFSIGTNNGNANPFNGYVSDLRITRGIARYTANFTAPTSVHLTM